MTGNTLAAVGAIVISVVVVAAVAVLAWHGTISGEAATGIFGTIIGGGSIGGAVVVGAKTGVTAAQSGAAGARN